MKSIAISSCILGTIQASAYVTSNIETNAKLLAVSCEVVFV